MAWASIHEPRGFGEEGTAYEVVASCGDAPDFSGPAHRDWDKFTVSGDRADFEWRTMNDRVRVIAASVVERKNPTLAVMRSRPVERWLAMRRAELARILKREGVTVEALSERQFVEVALTRFGAFVDNDPAFLSVYAPDDDIQSTDAAQCLELPPWGRVLARVTGSFGSGYVQALLVLGQGKGLGDLGAWLAALAAEGPAGDVGYRSNDLCDGFTFKTRPSARSRGPARRETGGADTAAPPGRLVRAR